MFWDIYHEGRFIERILSSRLSTAVRQAASRFRLPEWELEGVPVDG